MGMYQTEKEVPPSVLEQLLRNPSSPDWVDGLLFDAAGEWKREVTRSTLTDLELQQRFDCHQLPRTLEQMRTLGELDCGKYGVDDEWPTFAYVLRALEGGQPGESLTFLFETLRAAMQPGAPAADLAAALANRFAREVPLTAPAEASWFTDNGEPRYGFASNVPCYGIFSFSRPEELAATWATLRRALEQHPEHRAALLEHCGPVLEFHYGAAARRNASLSVMW